MSVLVEAVVSSVLKPKGGCDQPKLGIAVRTDPFDPTLLLHEILDEFLVLLNLPWRDALSRQLLEQDLPARIDPARREALLRVEAHMCDVLERASGRTRDERFIDLPSLLRLLSRRHLLLFLLILLDLGSILRPVRDLLIKVMRLVLCGKDECDSRGVTLPCMEEGLLLVVFDLIG